MFSSGDLSSSLTLAIQTFFQLYFLTDVVRLPPATVGWILGITRIWDAVNDPMIGLISDRIRSRFGRRRALLVYGSIPLGFFFALCWVIPPLSQPGQAIYYSLIFVAFDTAFTIVHVGYNSLTPTMTFDYDQRSSLNGFRMLFSLGGTLVAIVFATVLASTTMSEPERFAVVGLTLGAIAMIPPWIVFSVSANADNLHTTSRMSFRQALRTTLSNQAFIMLTCMYLASWTAASALAALLVYFVNYVLSAPEQANYFVLVAQGSAVMSVPLCVWLAHRWDKPTAFMVGIGFWCVVLSGFFVMPESAISAAYVCAFLCGPGIATAAVIPWSMLPDVIEQEQESTGERREGSYYAFASFFQKFGTGMALWGIGLALASSGYVTPEDGDPFPVQPESALSTIRFIIGPGTIMLLLISIPFAWRYPISRETHSQLVAKMGQDDG